MTALPPRDVLLPALAHLREQLAAIHGAALADEQLLADTLDGETNALEALRTICRHALEQEVFAQALNGRIAEMRARRDRFAAAAEACRGTARDGMEALGVKALPAEDFTASLGAGPQCVVVTNLDVLPEQFRRIKIEADKVALGKALKAGERIAGAELSNGGQPVLTLRRS